MNFIIICLGVPALIVCGYFSAAEHEWTTPKSKAVVLTWVFGALAIVCGLVEPLTCMLFLYLAGLMKGIADSVSA